MRSLKKRKSSARVLSASALDASGVVSESTNFGKSRSKKSPWPRDHLPKNCFAIAAYSSGSIFFFIPWMKIDGTKAILVSSTIFLGCFLFHYLVMHGRLRLWR